MPKHEPRITTTEQLVALLSKIVFANSVMDFKWRFEYVPMSMTYEGEGEGEGEFFDSNLNAMVKATNPTRKGWLIWASFERPDTNSGTMGRGRGRDEIIWEGATESAVVKTAWVIVQMLVQHELMEGYRVQQDDGTLARIFNPHNTVEQLASLQREEKPKPPYRLEPIPSYGDKMTIAEFYDQCDDFLTTDDGSGNLATDTEMSDLDAHQYSLPTVPPQFTHVIWFNK